MSLFHSVNLIFRAPFNRTLNPCELTCRRCVAKQQISLATHRNEHLGYEGPSGSLTPARWRICAARRPRSRVSLHAQPYQCFTDTFFFRPLSSPGATLSSFFAHETSCPCLTSASHSLTRDVFPLRTARDAPVIA